VGQERLIALALTLHWQYGGVTDEQ